MTSVYQENISSDLEISAISRQIEQLVDYKKHYGWTDLTAEHDYYRVLYFHSCLIKVLTEKFPTQVHKKVRILDVGDSDGLILKYVKTFLCGEAAVVGLNFEAKCADNIKHNGVNAIQGDAHYLPFKDDSFDFVFCFETLEHLENPILVLQNLKKIVTGKIFLSIPNFGRETRIYPKLDAQEYHIFEFSPADFSKILSHANLKACFYREIPVPIPLGWLNKIYLKLFYYPFFHRFFQFYELEKANLNK